MSTDFKCNDGNEHDFDSNTESEYCAKGCGEKWAIYAIKKLGADLKEKDAAVEQLKAENNLLKENLNFWQCNPCEVIQEANKVLNAENEQLKSKIEYANDEIHTLKNKLLMFEGMTFSENQEITALKSKLKIASAALEVVKVHNGINAHYPIVYATVTQALRDVGEI